MHKEILALKARAKDAEDRLETLHGTEGEIQKLKDEKQQWLIEREEKDHKIRDLHIKASIAQKQMIESEEETRHRQQEILTAMESVKKVDQTLAANDTAWQAKMAKLETK